MGLSTRKLGRLGIQISLYFKVYLKSKLFPHFMKRKLHAHCFCLIPLSLLPEHITKIIEGNLRIKVNITERRNCYFSTSKQEKLRQHLENWSSASCNQTRLSSYGGGRNCFIQIIWNNSCLLSADRMASIPATSLSYLMWDIIALLLLLQCVCWSVLIIAKYWNVSLIWRCFSVLKRTKNCSSEIYCKF